MKQRRLHVVLLDPREAPYAGRDYVLTVGRTELRGTTAADGSLVHEVPGLSSGELLLVVPSPAHAATPAPVEASVPAGAPPPYPPPISDGDFPDALPATVASTPEPVTLHWTLQLQSPATFEADALRALQERLHNLGYPVEGERGAPGPRTRAAVRAFQRHQGLPETGQLADVHRELVRLHDA
ncbi:peptidoglycan-binding domain-containing protein [Pyxidicoccus xibeiensis]|uniref:peptidoglycan-binding domain-containing protein n=1 Tax=Pyxidicoccus xibeiensis TaxID=2906759 RepID=UPI0020A70FC9|nr:peptidoglycan-binding domain-containing protein [Pyxidicoccus xibeiensis]MCP3143345.1 peptidoglycan-binding protein [Pyxidicoccus xibeiensis]